MKRFLIALVLTAPLTAAAPAFAADAKMDNKAVVRAFMEEMFNKHDIKAVDKYIATSMVEHSPMPGQKPGFAGVKAMFADMLKSMPDLHVTIDDIIVEGDRVAILSTMSGTPKMPMMGMQPAGRKISAKGIDWVVVKNGKAVEHWGYMDMDAMMKGYKPAAPKGKTK